MRPNQGRSRRKERLLNGGNRRRRNLRGQISVRHAAIAVLRGGLVLTFMVVIPSVVVAVVVMIERVVKYEVRQGNDVESQQPQAAGEKRPMWPGAVSKPGPSTHDAGNYWNPPVLSLGRADRSSTTPRAC